MSLLTNKTSIVFVHGLTGNRESTWTHKTNKVFWPKDLLPKDLPKARIITFGYDADIIRGLSTVGNGTLRDHGKALAEDLAIRRKITDSVRPFIALCTTNSVYNRQLLPQNFILSQRSREELSVKYPTYFVRS